MATKRTQNTRFYIWERFIDKELEKMGLIRSRESWRLGGLGLQISYAALRSPENQDLHHYHTSSSSPLPKPLMRPLLINELMAKFTLTFHDILITVLIDLAIVQPLPVQSSSRRGYRVIHVSQIRLMQMALTRTS